MKEYIVKYKNKKGNIDRIGPFDNSISASVVAEQVRGDVYEVEPKKKSKGWSIGGLIFLVIIAAKFINFAQKVNSVSYAQQQKAQVPGSNLEVTATPGPKPTQHLLFDCALQGSRYGETLDIYTLVSGKTIADALDFCNFMLHESEDDLGVIRVYLRDLEDKNLKEVCTDRNEWITVKVMAEDPSMWDKSFCEPAPDS